MSDKCSKWVPLSYIGEVVDGDSAFRETCLEPALPGSRRHPSPFPPLHSLTTLHQPLPNVSVKAPKVTILSCSLRCFERGLVSCKCIALRRAASRPSESHPIHPDYLFPRVPSQPHFHPPIFTAPSLFATKRCTGDPNVELGRPHNPIPSSSLSDLSSLCFNTV